MCLQATNWRPLVLVALMISQKVWDDKYLSNADFCYIYPFFDSDQLNTLEIKFLEMIQYNVYVKDSLYTMYYLELKSLVPEKAPYKPLNQFTLKKLEHQSKVFQDYCKAKFRTSEQFKESGQLSTVVIN